MKKYSAILFESNNYAMWCNDSLKQVGLSPKLINVPRYLSSDCGYCIRIETIHIPKATIILENEGIEYEQIAELNEE